MVALLVGMHGVAALTRQPLRSVRWWRQQEMTGALTRHLPREDVTAGKKPLWYSRTVVRWAVGESLLPEEHGLLVPDPRPVWHYRQIAEAFGVTTDTVRIRWRTQSVQARRSDDSGDRWLPVEDIVVEDTPLWYPETIRRWADQTGRTARVRGKSSSS